MAKSKTPPPPHKWKNTYISTLDIRELGRYWSDRDETPTYCTLCLVGSIDI